MACCMIRFGCGVGGQLLGGPLLVNTIRCPDASSERNRLFMTCIASSRPRLRIYAATGLRSYFEPVGPRWAQIIGGVRSRLCADDPVRCGPDLGPRIIVGAISSPPPAKGLAQIGAIGQPSRFAPIRRSMMGLEVSRSPSIEIINVQIGAKPCHLAQRRSNKPMVISHPATPDILHACGVRAPQAQARYSHRGGRQHCGLPSAASLGRRLSAVLSRNELLVSFRVAALLVVKRAG